MITRVGDGYVISANRCWRPGAFATERAARMGQRRSDEQLQRLQDAVNPGGVITEAMLRANPAAKAGT